MNILMGIAGVIIALYALYCALGMWIAHQIVSTENGKTAALDDEGLSITDHLPKTHIDFIKYYYQGKAGIVWKIGFILLLASFGALLANNQYAVYLFGLAIAIDCTLFVTYSKRKEFLSESTKTERAFDILQYSVLLFAFLVLAVDHLGIAK